MCLCVCVCVVCVIVWLCVCICLLLWVRVCECVCDGDIINHANKLSWKGNNIFQEFRLKITIFFPLPIKNNGVWVFVLPWSKVTLISSENNQRCVNVLDNEKNLTNLTTVLTQLSTPVFSPIYFHTLLMTTRGQGPRRLFQFGLVVVVAQARAGDRFKWSGT